MENLLNVRKLSLTMSELMSQIYYLSCMEKLHATDAARRGYSHVMVRIVDTDVVVIAVAKFQYFFLSRLWIEFGVGKYLKYLSAHEMFRSIGEEGVTRSSPISCLRRL